MSSTKHLTVRGEALAQGRSPLICTPIVGRSAEHILQECTLLVAKAPDVIEWRIDFFEQIGDTQAVLELGRELRTLTQRTPIIFTRRSTLEGGTPIPLDEAGVIALYEAVCAAGLADFVDYELVNPDANAQRIRAFTRAHGVGLILSYHNFSLTPPAGELFAKFGEAARRGADVAKVAVMPRSRSDVLELLQATDRADRELDIPLISMSMGGLGAITRMIGGEFGSVLTFAVGSQASAPGQIPIEALRTVLDVIHAANPAG